MHAWFSWIPSHFNRYLPVSATRIHCCSSLHAAKSQLKCSFNSPTWPFSSGFFETCAPTWPTLSDLLVAFNRLLILTLPYTHSHTHTYTHTYSHRYTHSNPLQTPAHKLIATSTRPKFGVQFSYNAAPRLQRPLALRSPPHYKFLYSCCIFFVFCLTLCPFFMQLMQML